MPESVVYCSNETHKRHHRPNLHRSHRRGPHHQTDNPIKIMTEEQKREEQRKVENRVKRWNESVEKVKALVREWRAKHLTNGKFNG